MNSRGSVMCPVSALAATVYGLARNTSDSLFPIRPGKFRFVAEIHFIGVFKRPKVSTGPPRHAAHDAFSVMRTPADSRIDQTLIPFQSVSFSSCTTLVVAGTPKVSIFTDLPFTTFANARKSLVFPPVHEPM